MNFLRIYPKPLREKYLENIGAAGIKNPQDYHSKILSQIIIVSIILTIGAYFIDIEPLVALFSSFIILWLYFYFQVSLKASARLKKMESNFPDVIQLMSSNLRAGMTIDHAFILASRPEFYPLDEEILKTGKEIATGKDMSQAMMDLGKRIGSEKIKKTLMLLVSGIRAGGNISTLLEQTSSNMREKEFLEKRASSNVLMYVIFIFFAVGIGAPLLFGLSSILVEIIISIVKNLPSSTTSMSLPFTFRDIGLSPVFIRYFAMLFILATDLLSSLVIGLINTGEEKSGLKYFPPLLAMSLGLFFGIRATLGKSLLETFSSLNP